MHYDQFRAMNSDIVLAADGELGAVTRGFARVREFIASSEARFTRFTDTSELAQLNRSAGSWFQASTEMFDVVQEACAYAEETNGLFDPTVLDALEAAGYDKSMDLIRQDGVPASRSTRTAHSGRSIRSPQYDFRAIVLDEAYHAIHLPKGVRLDLGGIAKGWIAEQAALILAVYAHACVVNAGGDLFAVGFPSGEAKWPIELEDPRDPQQAAAILQVGPGAVATSAITKRRWQQGDRLQHHLIDPRVGRPALTHWLSVTVIAPHATTAEVYAKALLIAGADDAQRISEKRGDITFIAVDTHGQLWGSPNSEELLHVIHQYA